MLVTAPRSGVVAQRAAVHAGIHRLLGGEISSLCLSQTVESIVIYVRHMGEIITYMSDI